jgi:hypothetical protein
MLKDGKLAVMVVPEEICLGSSKSGMSELHILEGVA